MKVALGRTEEEAYREQMHKTAEVRDVHVIACVHCLDNGFMQDLSGSVGLLFTNRDQKEVTKYVNLPFPSQNCFLPVCVL